MYVGLTQGGADFAFKVMYRTLLVTINCTLDCGTVKIRPHLEIVSKL